MVLSKSSYLQKEKYPCPDTVDGICSLIREVLSKGRIQSMEFSLGAPVRVVRSVEVDNPDLIEPDLDWEGALRNVEMTEYYNKDAEPYQVVVDVMHLMQSEGLTCTCWVTGTGGGGLLDKWFKFKERGLPVGVRSLLGRPVHRVKSLPEDTLVLCGSRYPDADPDEVDLAIKVAIEFGRRDEHSSSEIDDRKRVNPRERLTTACQLAVAGSRLNRVGR